MIILRNKNIECLFYFVYFKNLFNKISIDLKNQLEGGCCLVLPRNYQLLSTSNCVQLQTPNCQFLSQFHFLLSLLLVSSLQVKAVVY